MARQITSQTARMQALEEHLAQLRAIIERQEVRIEEQQQHIERQQAKIEALNEQASTTPARAVRAHRAGRSATSSRRALLKWGGAAAAAAAVTLVANEQAARANPAADGNNLVIGQANTGNNQTSLTIASSSSASPFFFVSAAGSTNANAIALQGNASATNGTGVYGFSNTGTGVGGASTSGYGVNGTSSGAGGGGSGSGVWGNNTSTGYGVYGTSSSGVGVYGTSTGWGVYGYSPSGTGVEGESDGSNTPGVYGRSSGSSGIGVLGNNVSSGFGVQAQSATGVDLAAQGTGRFLQKLQGSAGAPSSGTHIQGELIRDHNGELWLCVADGTPGHWVMAAHAAYGYTGGAVSYLSKPIRLLDTRGSDPNAQHNGGGPYTAGGSPYSLQIAGVLWQSVQVPSGAVGAIGKVTAVSTPAGGGFIALVPSGSGTPTTGNLPYGASATVATSFNVGLGGSPGALDIYVGGNPTDVVIDLFAVVA